MAKTITLKIQIDDGQALESVESLADGLADLDQRGARQASESLTTMFLKADLAGRGIAFVADEIRQLVSEAGRASVEVNKVTAQISTIANIDTSKVSRALFDISTRVPQAAQKLGEGLYNIFSSITTTQEQALVLLEKFGKGATAAITDTEVFGTAVMGVLNAYKLELTATDHVMDVFFNTVNKGVVTGAQLAGNLGVVTQAAKNAEVNFDTLGAMIAGVTKEGGDAAQNINNLANLLQKLPTKEATDELNKMGISIEKSDGSFRPVLDILTDLKAKLDALPPALRAAKLQEIFPDAQARTGLMTILSQLDFVKKAALDNANAAGVTEEAYKKMSQTAAAQFTLLYNSAIAFLSALSEWITQSKLLGATMSILGGILQTLSHHTGAVMGLVAALGLLVAAYNAVSIAAGISGAVQAISAFATGMGGTIFVIQNVVRAMIGLQTAFIGMEATIAAATGWGAVIAILGLVVYAYANAETAIDRANKVTLDSINANSESLQSYKQLAVEAQNVATAQEGSADRHEKLNAILGRLDPVTEAYIKSLKNEERQIQILTDKIDVHIEAQRALLEAKLRAAVEGALEAAAGIERESKIIEINQKNIQSLTTELLHLKQAQSNVTPGTEAWSNYSQAISLTENQIRTLIQSNLVAGQRVEDFNVALAENTVKILQIGKGLGFTNEQLQEYLTRTGHTKEQIDLLTAAANKTSDAQKDLAGNLNNTGDATKKLAADVSNLRKELNSLTDESQKKIDEQVLNIVKSAKDKAEARKMAQEALKNNADLKKAVEENKRIRESRRAVEDVFTPSTSSSSRTKSLGESFEKQFRSFASEIDFIVSRVFGSAINKGSLHPKRLAGDLDIRGKSIDEIVSALALGIQRGWRALDERFVGALPGVKTTGPNAHFELNPRRASMFIMNRPDLYGGQDVLDYLIDLDKKRLAKKGVTAEEIERFKRSRSEAQERAMREKSDRLTEDALRERVAEAMHRLNISGAMPDADSLQEIIRTRQEDARRAGQAVPLPRDIQRAIESRASRADSGVGLPEVEEQKGINETIRERFNLVEREGAYLIRKLHIEKEVAAAQEDYNLSLKEALLDSEIEYRVLSLRNLEMEASVKLAQQRNDQYRELMDIQVDLDVLHRQNADDAFVQERRLLAAKREEYGLQREITDLQDALSNQGINDHLKIQAAYLRDILDLRERETDAIIRSNRAQMEINASMQISNNEIRANVLEHLAAQETLSESIASGINKTYDALSSSVTGTLDELDKKTKGFLSWLIEPAKNLQRGALTDLTRGLLDRFFPELGETLDRAENPMLAESKSQTKLLAQIAANTGGLPAGFTGAGLGGIQSRLPGIFGGLTGGFAGGNPAASILGSARANFGNNAAPASATQSGLSGQGFFNFGGAGGVFNASGSEAQALARQTAMVFPSALQMAGSLVPGRIGRSLSYAGMGMQLGMMFGPIGSIIGTGIGALIGLFGGDAKRKEDAKQNIPQLRQGFVNSLNEFRQLITDTQNLKVDADDALKRGTEIRSQIASGFNISMKSKKYRKIAQNEIAAQLREIDRVPGGLMEQLQAAVARAAQAREFSNKFVATFASGGFVTQYHDFKRQYGLLRGGIPGKDSIPVLAMEGEVFLNKQHQRNLLRVTGRDVLSEIGLPNYPARPKPVLKMADGGFVGAVPQVVNQTPNIVLEGWKVEIHGVSVQEDVQVFLASPDGKRQIVGTVIEQIDSENHNSDGILHSINKGRSK